MISLIVETLTLGQVHYDYVTNVQLPDDYDSIFHDLFATKPLRVQPQDAPNRLSDVDIKTTLTQTRMFIPVFSFYNKVAYLNILTAVERNTFPQGRNRGWLSARPPSLPAPQQGLNLDVPPLRPSKKTFICDH